MLTKVEEERVVVWVSVIVVLQSSPARGGGSPQG
jgi:hypothetical protein